MKQTYFIEMKTIMSLHIVDHLVLNDVCSLRFLIFAIFYLLGTMCITVIDDTMQETSAIYHFPRKFNFNSNFTHFQYFRNDKR